MTKPTVSGSVVNGYFMGQVDGTGDIFNGDVLPAGPTSAYAGLDESTGVNGLVFAGDFIEDVARAVAERPEDLDGRGVVDLRSGCFDHIRA